MISTNFNIYSYIHCRALSFIGLTLIGIGTGGIKPCVATFGGEQFVMPYQKKPMTQFFSLFYAAVNCGSLISVLVTPVLRSSVTCFGQESCYPLAFGVPAGLMVIAVSKLNSFEYTKNYEKNWNSNKWKLKYSSYIFNSLKTGFSLSYIFPWSCLWHVQDDKTGREHYS